ncbi:MAG: hypothetical protein AMJ92_00025 [candidate division Zixibacteria bacterium SM23_81]|nr:MAG: hypothetical protein AMJ92_00025 [candidate division Zixibacteria bacterium SM23_81]
MDNKLAATHTFVANDELTGTMLHVLASTLEKVKPDRVCIATAYLTPEGFRAIQRGLEPVKHVQLLLGERPFFTRRGPGEILQEGDEELRGPVETISWFEFLEGKIPWVLMNHEERKKLLGEEGEEAFEARRQFNLESWHKVQDLVRFLERSGVEVRRFLGDKVGEVEDGKVLDTYTAPNVHLHAKVYLLREKSVSYGVVGSSNLTKGGLEGNIEANLITTDSGTTNQLEGWFERKWDQGQECREELIHRLEECVLFGRRFTPWQVFLKALHTAYGRFLGLGLSEGIADKLATFQQEGVSRAVELLERHWGAMVCDSVGLGKTYTGLGILKEYLARRKGNIKALVVCPAQLKNNWSHDKLRTWGIPGEMVSMEALRQLVDFEEVEDQARKRKLERRLRRLQKYDIVLVDESHNFRNPGTKQYRGLMEVMRGGVKQDKRLVLITATPINNSLWDLYHQLMLITRGDNSWYAGRGPVGNLEGTFRQLEKEGGGPGLLNTMLLTLVRRTRHDIRQRQEAGEPMEINGKPLVFPEHEIPEALQYSLIDLYGGIYKDVLETLSNLNFSIYNLERYGIPADTEDAKKEQERAIKRNESFIGILRTIYLKRMESSIAALLSSVSQQAIYLDIFLKLLEEGKILRPKSRDRMKIILGGHLTDDLLEERGGEERLKKLIESLPKVDRSSYRYDELSRDVKADSDALRSMVSKIETILKDGEGYQDPKVETLRNLLESLPEYDRHGIPTRIVIFTNFKDTARHIFRKLGGPDREQWRRQFYVRSNLRRQPWMSLLTGDDDPNRRYRIMSHFAPLATFREDEELDDPILQEQIEPFREEPIDILIATDVLSEGQNLQDAQFLVNYDLHWNPVRMIQRGGRIDRLFSPHDRVYIYNMMPEKGLEDLLKLVKRLQKRIQNIDATVGLDASVLGEVIEERALDDLVAIRSGGAEADRVYLEGEKRQNFDDALDQLRVYIDMVRELGTEEVRQVPDGIYSVKKGKKPGVFLMLKMPEEFGGQVFWRFYAADKSPVIGSAVEIVQHIAANRDILRAEIPEGRNPFEQLIEPLKKAIPELSQEYRRTRSAQDPGKLVRRVRQWLQVSEVEEAIPELAEKFHKWCGQHHPDDLLRREDSVQDAYRALNVVPDNDMAIQALKDLWVALETKGLDRPLPRPDSREPSEKDLQLICWEWVIPESGKVPKSPNESEHS